MRKLQMRWWCRCRLVAADEPLLKDLSPLEAGCGSTTVALVLEELASGGSDCGQVTTVSRNGVEDEAAAAAGLRFGRLKRGCFILPSTSMSMTSTCDLCGIREKDHVSYRSADFDAWASVRIEANDDACVRAPVSQTITIATVSGPIIELMVSEHTGGGRPMIDGQVSTGAHVPVHAHVVESQDDD